MNHLLLMCGPFPPSTHHRFQYVVNYIYLFNKTTQIYPFHTPTEVSDILKRWKNEWLEGKNLEINTIISAHLDNPKYFQNGEFGKLMNKWGWHAKYCPPYTHQLHPLEATNKQLLYTTRTL